MKTGAALVRLDGEAHAETVREHGLTRCNIVFGNPDVAASSTGCETEDIEANTSRLLDTKLEMALMQFAVACWWRRMNEKPAPPAGNVVATNPEQLG